METAPDPIRLTPTSGPEIAAALRRAADLRQSVLIRGAGTKLDWGRPPGRVDAIVDMRSLNRLLAHEHGDMTATVEAGASLRQVNQALADYGQFLPLDPPHADAATVGGILATNDSGPLRHRYGAPRDLLIGIQLATTDGALAKAGGRVVKNVAGYDLGKLVAGSFGALAAIVSATFKLSPLPPASKTVRLDIADAATLASLVRAATASQLEPIAFEISTRRSRQHIAIRALLRFASLPAVVDAQIARTVEHLKNFATAIDVAGGDEEQTLWREHARAPWTGGEAAVVRASWLPANIAAVLELLTAHAAEPAVIELVGRAAVGSGWIRVSGDADVQAQVVGQLRASTVIGNVVVVRGSATLKQRVDVWGSAGDRKPVFDAIKRAFDPRNILGAGRGPL